MTLKEALRAFSDDPVLINDGADYWTVDNLVCEINDDMLSREVYSCEDYIAFLDEQGYQITPPRYDIVHIGDEPYFVSHENSGYRVRFMINKDLERQRPIYGQSLYGAKQAAYRRKSQLNKEWQKFRTLGA